MIKFRKAGRKGPKKEKPFTKEELMIYKDAEEGMLALAKAVIKQWVDDGKPKEDAASILTWINFVRSYEKD